MDSFSEGGLSPGPGTSPPPWGMSYPLLGKHTHGIHFVQVIYKVALAQVHGELRMSRVTGKIGEDGGKPPGPSKMATLSWGPPGWVITGWGSPGVIGR